MGKDKCQRPKPDTNAHEAQECASVIYTEDGRVTHEPSQEHKGNWGRHLNSKNEELNNSSQSSISK